MSDLHTTNTQDATSDPPSPTYLLPKLESIHSFSSPDTHLLDRFLHQLAACFSITYAGIFYGQP